MATSAAHKYPRPTGPRLQQTPVGGTAHAQKLWHRAPWLSDAKCTAPSRMGQGVTLRQQRSPAAAASPTSALQLSPLSDPGMMACFRCAHKGRGDLSTASVQRLQHFAFSCNLCRTCYLFSANTSSYRHHTKSKPLLLGLASSFPRPAPAWPCNLRSAIAFQGLKLMQEHADVFC